MCPNDSTILWRQLSASGLLDWLSCTCYFILPILALPYVVGTVLLFKFIDGALANEKGAFHTRILKSVISWLDRRRVIQLTEDQLTDEQLTRLYRKCVGWLLKFCATGSLILLFPTIAIRLYPDWILNAFGVQSLFALSPYGLEKLVNLLRNLAFMGFLSATALSFLFLYCWQAIRKPKMLPKANTIQVPPKPPPPPIADAIQVSLKPPPPPKHPTKLPDESKVILILELMGIDSTVGRNFVELVTRSGHIDRTFERDRLTIHGKHCCIFEGGLKVFAGSTLEAQQHGLVDTHYYIRISRQGSSTEGDRVAMTKTIIPSHSGQRIQLGNDDELQFPKARYRVHLPETRL